MRPLLPLCALTAAALLGCRSDTPVPALVDIAQVEPGEPCEHGGTAVHSGLDDNGDGHLGQGEIDDTAFVCNGPPGADGDDGDDGESGPPGEGGATAMVRVDELEPGDTCEYGGVAVHAGNDLDFDGSLSDEEISSTYHVCDGPPGTPGETGSDGTPGGDGEDAVLRLDELAPGDECTFGGTKVHSGLDDDGDGVLSDTEIDTTRYVCDGEPGTGGTEALVRLDVEPEGDNCPFGGTAVHSGLDDDDDGALDDTEIEDTHYVCSGATGLHGDEALVDLIDEPSGENCAHGGTAVHSGLDDDNDGVLTEDEIEDTRYVCDGDPGDDGAHAVVRLDDTSPGAACTYGGTAVHSGLDTDGDGVLDDDEIASTDHVCHGAPGGDGDAALVRLVDEPPGESCPYGGTAVHSGIDDDDDGSLAENEFDATRYVCDGAPGDDGAQALVRLDDEPPGENCAFGGTAVNAGLDTNRDGALAGSEITFTSYVCEGAPSEVPSAWAVQGFTNACAPTDGSFATVPELDVDFVLDHDAIVLIEADMNVVGPDGYGVAMRLNVDGTPETNGTSTRQSGHSNEDDHLHLFRVLDLGPGQHSVSLEWGAATGGTVCNNAGNANPIWTRRLQVLTLPTSLGVTGGMVEGTTDLASNGVTTPGAFSPIADMAIDFTLDEPSVVLWQFDLNFNAANGEWTGIQTTMDGHTSGGTHAHLYGAGNLIDHLQVFDIATLDAGDHQLRGEWGIGSGTVENFASQPGFTRRLGYVAIPVRTGVKHAFTAPNQNHSHVGSATWSTIPGLSYSLHLDGPHDWIALSRFGFNFHGADSAWVAARLSTDGRPDLVGTHTQPASSSEDDHLNLHRLDYLRPGPHTFEGQWGLGGGTVSSSGANTTYGGTIWTQRLGTLAIPVKPAE